MLGVQVWMLGLGECSLKGRRGGRNKSTREEGAVGKLVGRQQPSSCKIREIKAIMGAAKTRSLRSRFELGGFVLSGPAGVEEWMWKGGFWGQAISRFQWPGGWTGLRRGCQDGRAAFWTFGWTIARLVKSQPDFGKTPLFQQDCTGCCCCCCFRRAGERASKAGRLTNGECERGGVVRELGRAWLMSGRVGEWARVSY